MAGFMRQGPHRRLAALVKHNVRGLKHLIGYLRGCIDALQDGEVIGRAFQFSEHTIEYSHNHSPHFSSRPKEDRIGVLGF